MRAWWLAEYTLCLISDFSTGRGRLILQEWMLKYRNNDTFYILLFNRIGEKPNGECMDRIDGDTVNAFIQNRFVYRCNASAETM